MKTAEIKQLSDPRFFKENRLDAHSDHIAYASPAEADAEESSYVLSLNGLWRFRYSPDLAGAPEDFYKTDADVSGWDEIRVPAHMQMEGYDTPQYVNIQYPWDGREAVEPGEIPQRFNPVGSYVRFFTLPEGFVKSGLYIRFEGVESCLYLWLNGHYVGFSSDSFDTKEFDLTPYLTGGVNRLAVRVVKWGASSWMEDQDFYRFSGIFRPVTLFTRTHVSVEDLRVRADAEEGGDGTLSVDLRLTGDGSAARAKLKLNRQVPKAAVRGLLPGEEPVNALIGGAGIAGPNPQGYPTALDAMEITGEALWETELSFRRGSRVRQEGVIAHIDQPAYWSAEDPALYVLTVELTDSKGELLEVIRQDVGFRTFVLGDDHIMRINGQRIVFNGADRHEFSMRVGRALSREEMVMDVIGMKRQNINAIRTSHYPNNRYLYRLCDRFGLYVIDETNLETHGTWDAYLNKVRGQDYILPGDKKAYLDMLLDRGNSMLQRDKNHPSILIWSCGNESWNGKDIYELSKFFHREDPTRLVHYEGVHFDRRYPASDMESQMYTHVQDIRAFLKENPDRPFILCEYTHAMANSCGGMHLYTQLTEEEPLFQGAFIWDYIDQGIITKDRYGREYAAYGGDLLERPHDAEFSGNGIAYGVNRRPSPKMQAVKANYQPFGITVDAAQLKVAIRNRTLFTGASDYRFVAELWAGGHILDSRELTVELEPGESGSFDLPLKEAKRAFTESTGAYREIGELLVRVRALTRTDTVYAAAGFEAAAGECALALDKAGSTGNAKLARVRKLLDGGSRILAGKNSEAGGMTPGSGQMEIIDSPNGLGVRGDDFDCLFSHVGSGGLISYRYGGKEMILGTPKPNFWRAPTSNDRANGLPVRAAQWKIASLYGALKMPAAYSDYNVAMVLERPKIRRAKDSVTLRYRYRLPGTPMKECFVEYTVHADGVILVHIELPPTPEYGPLPELSLMWSMPAEHHRISWYGLGPEETYPDRLPGAKLGLYRGLVEEQLSGYLYPQESGAKHGVRFAAVTDDRGRGLILAAMDSSDALTGGLANSDPEHAGGIPSMFVSAQPWTPHELEEAAHLYELAAPHRTVVRAGLTQMGIGGDDTWGSLTRPEYLLDTSRTLDFRFALKGI